MKNKKICIRVSEDYFNMIESICQKLGYTKSQYLLERSISPEIISISQNEDNDKFAHELKQINDQSLKLLQQFHFLETYIKDNYVLDNQLIQTKLLEIKEDIKPVRIKLDQILADITDEEKKIHRYSCIREILPEVEDYLENDDQGYLENLRRRNNLL